MLGLLGMGPSADPLTNLRPCISRIKGSRTNSVSFCMSLTAEQKTFAFEQIGIAQRALATLAEEGRNLGCEARRAIDAAREAVSLAECAVANQNVATDASAGPEDVVQAESDLRIPR